MAAAAFALPVLLGAAPIAVRATLVAFVVVTPPAGAVLVVSLLAAAVWFGALRRRGGLRELGVYDGTVASDVGDRAA